MTQFSIRLYATGELAEEITRYKNELSTVLGRPVDLPYCKLADDFSSKTLSPNDCLAQVDEAIMMAPKRDDAVVEVIEPCYSADKHWLELSSSWVNAVMTALTGQLQRSQTQICRREALHLVLASPATESQHEALRPLAEVLDWTVAAGWDMKLYRYVDGDWSVEGTWPIQQP